MGEHKIESLHKEPFKPPAAKLPGPREMLRDDDMRSESRRLGALLDDALSQVGTAYCSVKHCRGQKWPQLRVCEWRLEIRSRRPVGELFKDHLQDALEKEKAGLITMREGLKKVEDEAD